MTTTMIIEKISELAKLHSMTSSSLDGEKDAEALELQAEKLIIEYCKNKRYQVHGFPFDKKNSNDEDYFSIDRYRLYLGNLVVIHDDVAELMWHYNNSFWPDFYENVDDYITSVKNNLNSDSVYNVDF